MSVEVGPGIDLGPALDQPYIDALRGQVGGKGSARGSGADDYNIVNRYCHECDHITAPAPGS